MRARPQNPTHEPHPPEPQHDQPPPEASEKPFFWSIKRVAERWGVSTDTATRKLEQYRGRDGFIDLGSPGTRYKQKKSNIKIHPSLLEQIERDRRK
jgi:hypothetical protein